MDELKKLDKLRVAILSTDGVEQVELQQPRRALDSSGALTTLISPNDASIQGWNHDERGDRLDVDLSLDSANPDDYDALLLPGGVQNPDRLRQDPRAVRFVRSFFEQHKPVAAICHGPWMLVEADVVGGKTLTSWPSLQTDIRNAGGEWIDTEVVISGNLVTSRKPDDIPAFNRGMLEVFQGATTSR